MRAFRDRAEESKLVGTLAVFVASVVFGWRVQYQANVFRSRSDSLDRAERITKVSRASLWWFVKL
jgi:hypothetical protein